MNEATWRFVRQHADDDVRMLALRGTKDSEVDMTAALQQIQGQQTARRKLPSWATCEDILFPPHLSMEQCSSEQTGRYKAEVVKNLYEAKGHSFYEAKGGRLYEAKGNSFLNNEGGGFLNNEGDTPYESPLKLVDLTGGFGVDFSFLAPLFSEAVYVERQESLCALARHNFEVLGLRHAQVVCGTAEDFLGSLPSKADRAGGNLLIFLDPARRDEHGARTYGIADCTPDVLTLRDPLLDKADFVMLKLSPMLDWRKTVSDLGTDCVREVHIVSVGGECKELLLVLSKEGEGMRLVCENDGKRWGPTQKAIQKPTPSPSQEEGGLEKVRTGLTPQTPLLSGGGGGGLSAGGGLLLFEPNASAMKAGCFDALAAQFGVQQLAQNSHLFVASQPVDDFPGRGFKVETVVTMNKKELKQALGGLKQANITVRNFPLTVAELRKRLKLSEGGSVYIFATTLADGNHVLIFCQRL